MDAGLDRKGCALTLCAACLTLAAPAGAQLVAERITADNAAELLFGGSDADGGIGDWYLSNGIVELIVDDVGPQEDLPPGVTPPRKQSENAASGGTILDLGRVGEDNDQLNQIFTVGGLSFDNIILYDFLVPLVGPTSVTLVASGGLPGFPVDPSRLPVQTEFTLNEGDAFVTLRTRITNLTGVTISPFGGFFDVFPWTTRAVVPFTPLPGRGFRHGLLVPSDPLQALEQPLFAVGPGNVSPEDGTMDPETGGTAGEVSYGLRGLRTETDLDGRGGPNPPIVRNVVRLFGISGVEATAFGNLPIDLFLPPGATFSYERRLYVGTRNDVASTANPILTEIAQLLNFATGTLSGDVDAADGPDVAASVIATRTGGPAIPGLPDGTPTTHFRTDAAGQFADIVLPVGTYELELRSVERDPVVVSNVAVQAGADTQVVVPPLAAVAALELVVHAARTDGRGRKEPIPARVTILGRNGTPDPRLDFDFEALSFSPGEPDVDLRPETFGGALAQANLVYLPQGTGRVELRPGEYELFASRGPEYSVARSLVTLAPGDVQAVELDVTRIVPTPGALAADFHIHSARSLDSSAGPAGRVAAAAGEGVEVMVSADHDFVLDYAPLIAEQELGRYVTSIVGTETTSNVPNPPAFPNSAGHVNGWPLTVQPHARKDGAIEDEFVAPNLLFSRLRDAGAEVIQYNHLRAGVRGLGSIGFFNNIGCNRCANDIDRACSVDNDCPAAPEPRECTCVGYQPDRPLTQAPNDILLDDDVTGMSGVANPAGTRNIDFDVMEVANGLNIQGFLVLRKDWHSLLNQAYGATAQGPVPFLPGTAVSDSHRNSLETTGTFRTYVIGAGDVPAAMDASQLNEAIRSGRMVGTSGPYVELAVRDADGRWAEVGDTLVPSGPSVTLDIRVWATNWIDVEQVRVLANGAVVPGLVFDAASTPPVLEPPAEPWDASRERVLRFAHQVTLDLERDTWLLVEAGEPLDPLPEPHGFATQIVPGLFPFAFTNPIFVDLAGDGFDPPGVLPAAAPAGEALAAEAAEPSALPVHDHVNLRDVRIPLRAVWIALWEVRRFVQRGF